MVKSARETEKSLAEVSYELTEKMKKSREVSRSLFVVKDIKAGEIFTEENIRSIRPGYGLPPKYLKDILGKRAKIDIRLPPKPNPIIGYMRFVNFIAASSSGTM